MSNSNNLKSATKVSLSSNVQTIVNGGKAILTFTFSEKVNGFNLNDISVTNGTVTNLIQSLTLPNVYTADFIGGITDKSSMSTIKLDGDYESSFGSNGTPSNTVTIKNLGSTISVVSQIPTVGFTSNNLTVIEGNSGTTDMKFTLELSASSTESITVNYTSALKAFGTASCDLDYLPAIGSVIFAPGETSKTIVVKVAGDTVYENNESLYLDLTSAQGATIVTDGAEGSRNSWAVGTIINDDTAPNVGFRTNNVYIKEGDSDFTAMNFTVTLSASSTETVTVNYTTEQKTFGTAKSGLDYVPVTGSLVFKPGETLKNITVNVIGDKLHEANETFYIDLVSAQGAKLVTNGADGARSNWVVGNIVNDDLSATPTVGFKTNNTSVKEGNSGNVNMNFVLELSVASKETITVSYTTQQKTFGTAKADVDYVPFVSSVTFKPGETSKTLTIETIGDTVYEANETFYIDLVSASGATLVTNGADGARSNWSVGTIINDDILSVITTTSKGIFGTTSKDVIGGTSAANFIYGKGGADIITGFSGNDTFVFSKTDSSKLLVNAAQITDFKNGFDMIGLQNLSYGDLVVTQGCGKYEDDTIVSLSSNEIVVILIGTKASTIDATDFCNIV